MTKPKAALPGPMPVQFDAIASAPAEAIHSPVSGQPCVYWRLRVVEQVTPRVQLVHEVASTEAFELDWTVGAGRSPIRVRLDPQCAQIDGTPVLHRTGSAEAAAAARHLGLQGAVSVEEILIRPGDTLSAEGLLDDAAAREGAGPFRAVAEHIELFEGSIRAMSHTAPAAIAPALVLWVLGTAGLALSGLGAATYAAWKMNVWDHPEPSRVVPTQPAMGAARPPRPRLP